MLFATTFKGQTVPPSATTGYMYVREERPANTHNDASASGGNQQRVLNTTVVNSIVGASLAANDITLPAGTYELRAEVPAYQITSHQAHVFNVTDNAILSLGSSEYLGGNTNNSKSVIIGKFTFTAAKVIRILHYTSNSVTPGLGARSASGNTEIYTQVEIRKVA